MRSQLLSAFTCCSLFLFAVPFSFAQEENPLFSGADPCPPSHKKALLIFGEEPKDYEQREKTIQSLTNILIQSGFEKDRVEILKNGGNDDAVKADKTNILKALNRLLLVKPKSQDGVERELFVYASLKAIAPEGTQYLVCPSNSQTLPEIDFSNPDSIRYRQDHTIDLQKEFVEPISKSPIERRILILNTLSPKPITRGVNTIRERGLSSNDVLAPSLSKQQAFGQILIDDSLRLGPETINSFIDIYEKGMSGVADSTAGGNFDGKVEMNEIINYLDRFGNMAAPGAVRTVFKGQDFNLKLYQTEKNVLESQKQSRNDYVQRLKNQPIPQSKSNAPTAMPEKWYCLLFAVNEFENDNLGLTPLEGPGNDMELLKEKWLLPMREKMARSLNKKPDDVMEIVFLTDKANVGTGLSTRDNFYEELDRIAKKATPNDFILVAAACHGYSANGLGFLCPHDLSQIPFQDTKTGKPLALGNHAREHADSIRLIAVSDIINKLSNAKASKKLFLVDACRPETQSQTKSDFMTEFQTLMQRFYTQPNPQSENLAVLTSCSLGQLANEPQFDFGKPHGLFFHYLVEGLNEIENGVQADIKGNLNGTVSLNEAYSYAFNKTYEHCVNSNYNIQTPELFRSGGWESFPLMRSSLEDRDSLLTLPNEEYLLQRALVQKRTQNYGDSEEILTHLISWEPNNSLAYEYRAGVRLASLTPPQNADTRAAAPVMSVYQNALDDCEKVGKTLDLFVVAPQRNASVTLYQYPNGQRQTRIAIYNNQKVSISKISGDWLYVVRSSDKADQNGLGWIHKDSVAWSERNVDQYRPATKMNPRPATYSAGPMQSQPSRWGAPSPISPGSTVPINTGFGIGQ